MIPVTLLNVTLYCLAFSAIYYIGICLYKRKIVSIEIPKLLFYISIFSVFGVAGEIVVNNLFLWLTDSPLWVYQLYPAHAGDVSYFFLGIWGALGFYKYINDTAIHLPTNDVLKPAIIMGTEAILLELAYNGLFLFLFGQYIFYYFPENLGRLSHLSCLEVIPFYFAVGFCLSVLIKKQNVVGYGKHLVITLPFLWMVIAALII
jgi:hypothetical protein